MRREIKLTPLHIGTLKRDKTAFVMGAPSQAIDVPVIMFLVQTADVNLLVDTGTRDPNHTPPIHGLYEQTEAQRPERVLANLGLKVNDIDIVINTHLHWDHCSNNHLFPKARFYVQREELRYAIAPLPAHAHGYESSELGLTPPFFGTKFVVIEGDQAIVNHVSVLLTPGHTPGSQSVVLTSDEGACVIASDNIPFYENLKGNDISCFKPSCLYVDLEAYYRSIRRVVDLGMPVIPGHDIAAIGKESLFG